ncbi:unnamed protein product [Cuscuta campestris]|uniref:Protein SCAR n=1 Tax=Cuscuta campestris TaxID=132261 RepID=A0A484MZN3_9ASTE|nr:unnamed protein product [Cuscuta campestris]
MPLVRVRVRNEYALGAAELYGEADNEDPKAVLEGVAVAGLVGVLRQLGDLVEFAAEVFHGLQEQVTITSSRSRKLIARAQRIEIALPSLEKSILAQRSHLHLAYTAGSNWHTRCHREENHFIYSDLPRFLMDSYEECRGPPRLHLLDKFDPGGPGSCLKRYSDPTFFKRASAGCDEAYLGKVLKDKKGRKIKKKRSRQKNRELSHGASSFPNYSSRMESRRIDGQTSPPQIISTQEEGGPCPSSLMKPEEDKAREISSPVKSNHDDSSGCRFSGEKRGDDCVGICLSKENAGHISSLDTRKELRRPEEDKSRQSSSTASHMYTNGSLDSVHPDEKGGDAYGDISDGYSEEHNAVTWDGKRQAEEESLHTQSFDSVYASASADGFSCLLSQMLPNEDKTKEIASPLKSDRDSSSDFRFSDEKRDDKCVGISLLEVQTSHILYHGSMEKLRRVEEDNSRQSSSTSLRAYSNGSLDLVCVDEVAGDVRDDINIGYSEEHDVVAWNGKRQPEEDVLRLSFPIPSQIDSNGSIDYPIPDENYVVMCDDSRNDFSEHNDYILYSVTLKNSARPSELTPIESKYYLSQKSQDTALASADENVRVVSDETGSDLSMKQICPSQSCSTLDRKMDTPETTLHDCNDSDGFLETHAATVGVDTQITAVVTHDTVEQKVWVVPDETGSDLSMKQICPSSSCNTLDRKMDMSENISHNYNDGDEISEAYAANVGAEAQIAADVTHDSAEQSLYAVSDETGSDLLMKHICPSSSCSTLDRKMDSSETALHKWNDGDEILETHAANVAEDAQIAADVGLDTVQQIDSLLEKMDHKGSIDSASMYEKDWVVSDEIVSDIFQNQSFSTPCCSTLDRKMDSLHIIHPMCNDDENLETYSANVSADAHTTAAVTLGTNEQIDLPLENGKTHMPNYGDIVFDELESEADDFEDALNTIDSESENDLDHQIKKLVDQDSCLDAEVAEDATPGTITSYADNISPNSTSEAGESAEGKVTCGDYSYAVPTEYDSTACFSSEKLTHDDTFHANALECNTCLESPQVSDITSDPGLKRDILNENGDALVASDLESISKLSSASRENGLGITNMVACSSEPSKPLTEPSSVMSDKFWTNGYLLGLQPAKPPDSVLKAVTGVLMGTQDDAFSTPEQNNCPTGEMNVRTPCLKENGSKQIEESQQSMKFCDDHSDDVSVGNRFLSFSSVGLDAKMEKSNHSSYQNHINSPMGSGFNESDTVTSRTLLPVATNLERVSMGHENANNSSRILSLGNRLLAYGFHFKTSSLSSDNSFASSMTSKLSEQKDYYEDFTAKTFSERTTNISGSGSPMMSPSWSPPLGHMKISFQPIDGPQTHKLKLRFPNRGTGGEMFPSFQLVPEAAISFHDISSDSDDDTFCRSSPCMSDDCLSHQSESNSDQWESGESSSIKDHEVYNALRRISLTEFTSTSFENRLTTQEELHHDSGEGLILYPEHCFEQPTSGYFSDLPVLDTLRPALLQESGNCSTATACVEGQSPKELIPPHPFFPPHNCHAMKSLSDVIADKKDSLMKGHTYTADKKLWNDPLNQDIVMEPAFVLNGKGLDMQQIGEQKVVDQAASCKEIEEKGDFLHQIRAKSFSLRPAFTKRPNHTTGLPPSVNAILEKANAIRQAVGSDREDDGWSDT